MKVSSHRVAICATVLIGLLLVGHWLQRASSVEAVEQVRTFIDFDRADIPADQPAAWPKEVQRCVDVPREEFISLIEQLNSRSRGPRWAWLKSAHYEATLVNDTLRNGLMTASVQRLDGPVSLLELGPFSFALQELKWQDRPAIWGSSADGRAWVLTDGENDELLGEWSCKGRPFPGGIDFDLQLPEATTSFLDLRIPSGFSVHSPTADVTLLSDVPNEPTQLWRIHCGSEHVCRVTCVSREGIEERRSALLVEHDMNVIVREEDLRFQLILNLEALDSPVRDITLRIPAGLTIYSANYGADTPVPIQRKPESDGKLSIRLPGPLSGRGRPLRIDGIATKEPDRPAVSPHVVVENGTFVGGRQLLTVQSPLQVRSIRSSGYRQLTPATPTLDGEIFTFQQLTSDAQLILDVHRPPVSLSGQLLSLLSADEDSWMLDTEIIWTSPTGGGFRASCLFPSNWEVTDVHMAGRANGLQETESQNGVQRTLDSDKLSWDIQSQPGGQSPAGDQMVLAIEFLEVIQPGQTRAVRVIARRRPPEPGQAVSLPLPQLLNCDTTEVTFGIQNPDSMTPDLSEEIRLERIAHPTTASFPAAPDNYERRWYRGDSLEGTATFKLVPRLPPVAVRTETAVEALLSEYRVRYSLQYQPNDPISDRLLIYLTEPNTDVRWTLKGAQPIELTASRLKKSLHLEWNLSSKGELWEIKLPRSLEREVTIEGISTNRWSVANRPALAFVPQAIDKLAQLKLTHPDSLEVNLELDGLKPTGQRMCWWYSTPEAGVELAIRNPEPSREFPLMVSIQLSTLMSTDTNGFDLYRAQLQLENGSARETLRIKLDPKAVVQDAVVDGESVAVNLRLGEFSIPGLNATRRDVVELVYRVPARGNVIYEKRSIVVPQVSAQVLGFFWEFAVPPSSRLFAEPKGARLTGLLPSPTWNERIFGPLGRTETEQIFQPLRLEAWRQLFQPDPPYLSSDSAFQRASEAPAEWQRHQASSPELPAELSVELWHSSRVRLLTWISFCSCLTLGIGLRMLGWRYRDRVAAYILGLSLAATFSAPAPFAGFLGGAISGTLIGLLIPRQLLFPYEAANTRKTTQPLSLPTTLTASLLGGLTFFGLSPIVFGNALAEEPIVEHGTGAKHPVVFVPVDKNGQPSATLPLVYVPRDSFARWKAMSRDRSATPTYLLSNARYDLIGAADGHWNFLAKYQVHLLNPSASSVVVPITLTDVSLPDADSCLVNGIPHPIGALPNGGGYSIELGSPRNTRDVDSTRGHVTSFEIELRLRKPRPNGRGFELSIPPVANSHIKVALPEAFPFVEILGGRGSTERDKIDRVIECDLGSTKQLEVRWGQSAPRLKPQQATVSLLQHLELRPNSAELRFHLKAILDEGNLDSIEFNIPENAVVRSIQTRNEDLLRSDVIVTTGGQRRLRVVFEKPHRAPIVVEGSLLLLQTDSLVQTPLPKFGLVSSHGMQFRYDHNWWGVSAQNDYRIEASNLDPENVNTISADAYLQAWEDSADPRHPESGIPRPPQSAFELREGTTPVFVLAQFQSRRRAVQWKQVGAIGKRRLEWTLTGEIETVQSSTYQTILNVDRRLRIEIVSVIENGAERRTRWTESRTDPSRVVIFLSDKAQGKQTITLRGSLPLTSGVAIALPFVRPDDCDVTNSQLVLTRDPEVDVILTPHREWKPEIDNSTNVKTEPDGQIIEGSFQVSDPVVRGTIQTSSRHSRCSTRAAAILRRMEGSAWRLIYRIEMIPEGDSPLRMGLNFPASFNEADSVFVERAEPAWHDISDGVRQLDLLLNRGAGSGSVVVEFEASLTEPKQAEWELPFPVPLHSNGLETLLVVEPENIWYPINGRDVRIADLPDWSAGFYENLPGGSSAFRISGSSIRIQRDIKPPNLREPSLRLLDQRMWFHKDGRCSGVSQAYISSVRDELEFDLPSGLIVTALFLDDYPLPLVSSAERRLKVSMTDAGTESILTIAWSAEPGYASFGRPVSSQLLWPRDIRVERNLMTIVPDNPTTLWCRSGLTETSQFDQGLDRLEALLDRHHALGSETRGAASNRWWLHQLQSRLLTLVPKEIEHRTIQSDYRLQRRAQIVESLDQLEPVSDAPSISWHARLLEEPASDFKGTVRGSGNRDGTIRLWRFDRRWILGGCSAVLALILIPLFRRIIRVEWSEWLHRHVAVSWLMLATFWWLFLTPSALGTVLLLVAMFSAVTQYKHAKQAL
jgi:hypothetical protein